MNRLCTALFALLVSSVIVLPATAAPEIIGHRGASYDAPENTAASANLAWKQNADAVEIDIYLTADHQIAVIHDPTTTRTTGVAMKVAASDMADLQKLDASNKKGARYAGEKIPTLPEVLRTIPQGKRLFIEIKCNAAILPYLLKTLDESGKDPKQIVIISFYADVIRDLEKIRPQLKTYYLCAPKPGNVDKLVRVARVIGTDGIDGQATDGFNAAVIAKLREAKLGVYVWTIDDEPTASKYAGLGIEGITTNKPAYMRSILAGPEAK